MVWHHPDCRAEAAALALVMGIHPWSVEPTMGSTKRQLKGDQGWLNRWLREGTVTNLPENLHLVDLAINQRFWLGTLPKGLQAINLHIRNAPILKDLNGVIRANHLQVTDCPSLQALCPTIQAFYARFARLPVLEQGPRFLRSQGEVRFEGCERLTGLHLDGTADVLTIAFCPSLRELSGSIRIRRLVVQHCPSFSCAGLLTSPQEVDIQECPRPVSEAILRRKDLDPAALGTNGIPLGQTSSLPTGNGCRGDIQETVSVDPNTPSFLQESR
jgi:hypothetical protein